MDTNELHELLGRYAKGEATEAEARRLQQWYESNFDKNIEEVIGPDHYAKKQIFDQLSERIPELERRRGRIRRFTGWRIAAALTMFIGIGGLLYFAIFSGKGDASIRYITIENSEGGVKELYLPDSTKIWLNARSSLKYAENFRNNRLVELIGEGFFEVAHDMEHPFIIYTGKLRTKVLGTAFNIKAYPNESEIAISVEHGKVTVNEQDKTLAMLQSLDQVTYEVSSGESTIGKVDRNDIVALKLGEIRFNAMPLGLIANVLERKYGVAITFENELLTECMYSAAFDHTVALDDLLLMLCSVNDIDYEYSSKIKLVMLSGRGCN